MEWKRLLEMQPNNEIPKWEREGFMFTQSDILPDLNMSSEELNGVALLKRRREMVHTYGFTMLAHLDGRQRSGKSISAILLAILWDKSFLANFDRRIVHTADDFLEEIRRIEAENIKGAVIVVDEAGYSMSASDWYQRFADAIQKSIEVFGYLHIVVLFVSPVKDFLLSGLRKMTNIYIRVKRFNNNETNLIMYDIDYGLRKNRMDYFYKKPRLSVFGQKITMRKLKIRNPPKWLLDKYRALEQRRKPKIMEELRIKGIHQQQEAAKIGTFEDKVKFVIENYEIFKADRATPLEPRLDADLIKSSSLEIKTFREAQAVKKRAERMMKEIVEKKKAIITATGNQEQVVEERYQATPGGP